MSAKMYSMSWQQVLLDFSKFKVAVGPTPKK